MRFSLQTLLAVFAIIAVGCAGIFYPNAYLTTSFFTLTILVLSYGLTAAVLGDGDQRAYWIGFTIFGGVYFFAAFYGDLQPNYRNEYTYRLVTSQALRSFDD